MQSSIYNFYCLNTLAKHFFRLNPTASYMNYNLALNPDISVRSLSNTIPNKLIVFDTDVQFKNKRFIETVMYSRPDRERINIKYNIEIFNDLSLDTSLKFVFFPEKEKLNPYFWSNLSVENQGDLNKITELLVSFDFKDRLTDFTICK